MKVLVPILFCLLLSGISNAQDTIVDGPMIEFQSLVFDYGTIEYNGDGRSVWVFKNIGNKPLILSRARSSCGCLIASWPKEPIQPGESAEIKARYDTRRAGPINKSITVESNAVNKPTVVLRIKGVVKRKPEE